MNNMLLNLLNASLQPFRATPDTRFYFEHPSIETARQTVLRAVIRAEGPAVVLGGSGFGKTLLAELIADQLCQRMDIVMMQSARLSSRRSLLQSILFELKLPYLDMSEGELRLSILDRLEPSPETAPEGVLIIVDEAHTLQWKLLDELRLISNFARDHQPRVKLVLFGNMRFEETLASPQLESFNQRLAARCYLQSMSRQETSNYIFHQLRKSGVDPNTIITQEAIGSVFSASQGIPRLVNQLMDHSIWLASTTAQSPISAALVNDAWSDLQQLPTPWGTEKFNQSEIQSTVEFGDLSDDDDDQDVLEVAPEAVAAPSNWPFDPSFEQNLVAEIGPFFDAVQPTAIAVAARSCERCCASECSGCNKDCNGDCGGDCNGDCNGDCGGVVNEMTDMSPSAFSGTNDSSSLAELNFFSAFQSTPANWFMGQNAANSEDDSWRIEPGQSENQELETNFPTLTADPVMDSQSTPVPLASIETSPFNWFMPSTTSQSDALSTSDRPFPNSPEADLTVSERSDFKWMSAELSVDELAIPKAPPYDGSDRERISGLMAEQQQYDAMGVWENDPPLARSTHHESTDRPLAMSLRDKFFGNDFDDERVVSVQPVGLVRQVLPETTARAESESGESGNPDYLERMQRYADAISSAADNSGETASLLRADSSSFSSVVTAHDNSLSEPLWQINVNVQAGVAERDKPLEDCIEDMVAQLNFSAFSIQPFSIEQIPLESERPPIPVDSIRRKGEEQVYLMHRPIQHHQQAADAEPFGDDRDLIIIEEEIPKSVIELTVNSGERSTQKPPAYAQLFAKLRK